MTLPSRRLERDGRVALRVLVVVVGGLADAFLVGDDLVLLRVEIIGAGLQHLTEDALLVVLFREAAGPVLAQKPATHADHAGLDLDRGDGLHLVAVGVDAVAARRQHRPANALFGVGVHQHLAVLRLVAAQLRHHADLTRLHDRVVLQLRFVIDRRDPVPAFAEHVLLHALLAGVGQHLAGRQRLAVLGDHHQHLARRNVVEEGVPEAAQDHADDHEDHGAGPEVAEATRAGTGQAEGVVVVGRDISRGHGWFPWFVDFPASGGRQPPDSSSCRRPYAQSGG